MLRGLLIAVVLPASALAGVLEDVATVEPWRAYRVATDAPAIPDEAYVQAASDGPVAGVEFVEGVAAGKGWGVAIYDVPAARVWQAVNSEDGHERWLGVSESAVVGGTPFVTGRHVFQYLPLPIVKDRWWVIRVDDNPDIAKASDGAVREKVMTDVTDEVSLADTGFAEMTEKGTAIAWSKGSWFVAELPDGRSLAEYFVWSDPGGIIPARPASRFAKGAIRDALAAMGQLAAELETGAAD